MVRATKTLCLAAVMAAACGLASPGHAASPEEQKRTEPAKKLDEPKLSPLMQAARAAQAKRDRANASVPTFTTEDLTKRFGEAPGGGVYTNDSAKADPGTSTAADPTGASAASAPGATLGDPLQAMQQAEAEQAVRVKKQAEAQAAVTRLTGQIQVLEKRSLAISNPFLPRPKVDENDPGKKEWDNATAKERRDQTLKQLEDLRRQLTAAQNELNRGS